MKVLLKTSTSSIFDLISDLHSDLTTISTRSPSCSSTELFILRE